MPGTRVQGNSVIDSLQGYNLTAVTAAQVLWKCVPPFFGRIKGVKAFADTAGTGAGNTVLDITRNGTSIWTTAANRPTLAATSTGEFANSDPDLGNFRPGDQLALIVSAISTTGHASLYAHAAMVVD